MAPELGVGFHIYLPLLCRDLVWPELPQSVCVLSRLLWVWKGYCPAVFAEQYSLYSFTASQALTLLLPLLQQ